MNPLLAIRAAVGLAFLLLAIWAFRVDSLRADHLETIQGTVKVLVDAGLAGANRGNLAAATKTLVDQRDLAREERNTARNLVNIQSRSIKALSDETTQYLENAKAQKRLIEETTRQRDLWIKKAKEASTRVERLTAEQELKQCEDVLDSLYAQSF